MGKATLALAFAAVSLFILQNVSALNLESFMVDALDSTMMALERDRTVKNIKKVTTGHKGISAVVPRKKWGSTGRRRRFASRKVVTKKRVARKIPKNKNLQAANQIQNGMLEASAMRNGISNSRLQQQIKQACNSKQFIFARQMLGHNIFNLQKAASGRRVRRSASSPGDVLKKIEREIGAAKFKRLLAYDGAVTLAFALDTTGSMGDDISAAKSIVTDIVSYDRPFPVDYVLSPFNDPITDKYHGPMTYMDHTQTAQFHALVNNVDVDGGGDCDELALTGIKEIYSSPLQYQSPIYVLTDAGAKDGTDDNVETLKDMIDAYQSPINFFLSNTGCLKPKAINLYKSLADFSGGQLLYFSNKKNIGITNTLVKKGLIGGSSIPVIPNKRRRRGIAAKEYTILVDDTVETLTVTVLDKAGSSILLRNPSGSLQLSGKVNTGHGALYIVERPPSGVWKISTSDSGYITTKCISYENIDFEYNFIAQVKVGLRSKVIPTNAPVKGKQATVIITVPSHAKTVPSSLSLKVVDVDLNTIRTVSLRQHGRTNGRFKGTFPTPSHDFKLVLDGRTKSNRPFSRLGSGIIKPKEVIIHIFSAPRGFALTAGSSSPTTILFAVHSYVARDVFEVRVDESKKFLTRLPRRVYGFPGRMALFSLAFKAPSGSKKGQAYNVVVSVIGKKTGFKSRKHVQLLIV